MKDEVLKYLGYHNQELTEDMNKLIDDVIEEVKKTADFHYAYQERNDDLLFLHNEAYQSLLAGCTSYLLVATTLGFEIDRKIKYYQNIDSARALVFDAASSAYLIEQADLFEGRFNDRTYRFCPGYENTPLDDNRIILDILKDSKPGISILDSKMLVPAKSMVGIIGLGVAKNKNCQNCVVKNCMFKEEGITCFKK